MTENRPGKPESRSGNIRSVGRPPTMSPTSDLIVLLTDFGLKDHYVGVMKGVILGINPKARLVDLSHEIPSQGVLDAYFMLSNSYPYFPDGAIFVAVVDPGVGTEREILAVQTDRHTFLAPDNGLLGFLGEKIRRAVCVRNRKYALHPVSATFHGRDLFAPAAAHLSLGLDLGELGPEAGSIRKLAPPTPRVTREGVILGEVVAIDRFGNLVTNIPAQPLASADAVKVRVGRTTIERLSPSYAAGPPGQPIAVAGSTGTLEISINRGNASRKLGARVGTPVRVLHSQT